MRPLDFIIFGVGRSGTTALVNAVNYHPDIFCSVERFDTATDPKLIQFPEALENASFKCDPSNMKRTLDLYARKGENVEFAGDKNPRWFCGLKAWHDFKPDLRKIAIYRSPYEYLASWQARAENPNDGWHKELHGAFGIYELFGMLRNLLAYGEDTLLVPYNAFYIENDEVVFEIIKHIGADEGRFPFHEFKAKIFSKSGKAKERPVLPADVMEMLAVAKIDTIDKILLRNSTFRIGDARAEIEAWMEAIPPELGVLADKSFAKRDRHDLDLQLKYWVGHFPQLQSMPHPAALPEHFKPHFEQRFPSEVQKPVAVQEDPPMDLSKLIPGLSAGKDDYAKRIKEQIDQYKNVDNMHAALSDMHEYWKRKHLVPVWQKVCEATNVYDFYARNFIRGMEETGSRTVASLGSGDGRLEIEVAKRMKVLGAKDFVLQCVELSEHQTARGDKHAKDAGVSDCVQQVLGDFNSWESPVPLAGVMANHALHHVADLETMFGNARKALGAHGKFVTIDVIGRNGHMRWPETLDIVESIWNFLPMDKRYHHIFKKTCKDYLNHDCSTQGFEGIRAQDILPVMMQHFEFEYFYAYGGITEAFINRGYGANYDAKSEEDKAFVDFLHKLNEMLIDLGQIKPTVMFSCASGERTRELRVFNKRTPEFCVRNTAL